MNLSKKIKLSTAALVFGLGVIFSITPTTSTYAGKVQLIMQRAPCPGGGTYLRCWHYCGSCDCSVSAQTVCDGGAQQ